MQQRALKVVIFDFDCTLTVAHVFATLAGVPSSSKTTLSVPPPHVRSELGQLLRLAELEKEEGWGPAAFAVKVFGGDERLSQLRLLLVELHSEGIACMVCSRGMQATLRKLLEQVNLLCYFSMTKGSCGAALGLTNYDMRLLNPGFSGEGEVYLDATSYQGLEDKSDTITQWMQDFGLHADEVLYIDDDEEEIQRVVNVCRTMFVSGDNGMGAEEFQRIRDVIKNKVHLPCEVSSPAPRESARSAYGLMETQTIPVKIPQIYPAELNIGFKPNCVQERVEARCQNRDSPPASILSRLRQSYEAVPPAMLQMSRSFAASSSTHAPSSSSTQASSSSHAFGVESPASRTRVINIPSVNIPSVSVRESVSVGTTSSIFAMNAGFVARVGNSSISPSRWDRGTSPSKIEVSVFRRRDDKSPLPSPCVGASHSAESRPSSPDGRMKRPSISPMSFQCLDGNYSADSRQSTPDRRMNRSLRFSRDHRDHDTSSPWKPSVLPPSNTGHKNSYENLPGVRQGSDGFAYGPALASQSTLRSAEQARAKQARVEAEVDRLEKMRQALAERRGQVEVEVDRLEKMRQALAEGRGAAEKARSASPFAKYRDLRDATLSGSEQSLFRNRGFDLFSTQRPDLLTPVPSHA
jgi:hypothetical protein